MAEDLCKSSALRAIPRRRIAIVLPNFAGGGVERVRLALMNALVACGHEVDLVLCRREGVLLQDLPQAIRVVDLQAPRLRAAFMPLRDYLRRRRPDVVLVAMWPLTVVAALAHVLVRVPCRLVLTEHSTLSASPVGRGRWRRGVMGLTMRLAYRHADAVIAVSSGVRDDLADLSGLSPHDIHVVFNPWIAPSAASREMDDDIRRWWFQGDAARLIAVGTLKPAKDYPTLLRAFEKARQRRSMRLLILGEGGLRSELEHLVTELGIEGDVRLAGFKATPEDYLRRADLLVLSSAWEGFGNVIVEALGCGVPVVSTDCRSGPAEILDRGRYGRLVPVGDVDALAEGILHTLKERHEPSRLQARAAEFSFDAVVTTYLTHLLPPQDA